MKKQELLERLLKEKLVAVIRGQDAEEVAATVDAVKAGGIHFMEITFTIPKADQVIDTLSNRYKEDPDVIIGAGTVLDVPTARAAILAGARFVVTPGFNPDIMKLCNLYRIPCMPGAATVTEMTQALEYGADIIKLFPGSTFKPADIKAFHGPLPQADFMPTGGVSASNLKEWLDNGAVAVGTGGSLTKGAATGDFAAVTREAEKLVRIAAEA